MKDKSCILCGGPGGVIENVGPGVYYYCPHCRLVFLDEKYHLSAQEEKSRYQRHENTLHNKGYVKYLNQFIDDAGIGELDGIKNVLDFGCGPGPVLKALLNERALNVDIYDPYFYPQKVFKGKQYDLITCTEVLEHVRNPLAILKLLESLLDENGVLAVKTVFYTAARDFNKWWYRQDPTHICFYCPQTFAWIGECFNFKIELIDDHSLCVLRRTLDTGMQANNR